MTEQNKQNTVLLIMVGSAINSVAILNLLDWIRGDSPPVMLSLIVWCAFLAFWFFGLLARTKNKQV